MPMDQDEKWTKNPVFGTINLNRVTSTGRHLFGSDTEHGGFISLTVHEAESIENEVTGEHRTFNRAQIVEVWMSDAQFAQFISTWNRGEGTPCTLSRRPEPGFKLYSPDGPTKPKSARQRLQKVIDDAAVRTQRDINTVADEIEKLVLPRMPKKDADKVKHLFRILRENPAATLTFTQEMLHENLEKMIGHARVEREAAGRNLLERMGLQHLASEAKKLLPRSSIAEDVIDAEAQPMLEEKKGE